MASLLNKAAACRRIKARTAEIVVGDAYFLSTFYDKDGATVRVLSKSTKKNGAGWPSSVKVEVLCPLGREAEPGHTHYAIGTVHNVNATNLYERRDAAGSRKKFAGFLTAEKGVRRF